MIILDTNLGKIQIELDYDNTPASAKNFEQYAKDGFYNGTIFHRVIDGFMVQGGGFEEGMVQKSTNDPVENEADKGQSNKRGTLAMARTSDPHSATAQFFINTKDNDFLDHKAKNESGWGYCVFAKVIDGMDVVDKISKTETTYRDGHQDVPQDDVIINSVIVED